MFVYHLCNDFFSFHNDDHRKILNTGIMMDITLTLKEMTKVFISQSPSLSGLFDAVEKELDTDFGCGFNFDLCSKPYFSVVGIF